MIRLDTLQHHTLVCVGLLHKIAIKKYPKACSYDVKRFQEAPIIKSLNYLLLFFIGQ